MLISDRSLLADKLLGGSVAIMSTDTVYGICARATDSGAVARLYSLKSRDKKPGTLIASSVDQLVGLGIKRRYLKAVEQFWPGALSVVVPTASSNLGYLDLGLGTLAMRVVEDKSLVDVLQRTGPLISTSANLPGCPPADTIAEAIDYFGDKVDVYMDGGDLSGREASTIIRIVDDAVDVLRPGAVRIDENGQIIN